MTTPTMRYEIKAENTVTGVSEARCKQWVTTFDTGSAQNPDLAGPAELFAAAFAACVLKNVSRFSEMLPFQYEHAVIDVLAEREDAPPRITRIHYVLRLTTNEHETRLRNLLKNIEKFGTIYNTLRAVCEVSGEVIAEPSGVSVQTGK